MNFYDQLWNIEGERHVGLNLVSTEMKENRNEHKEMVCSVMSAIKFNLI